MYVPFRTRKGDPNRKRSSVISQLRWLVETVLGQLSERYVIKRPGVETCGISIPSPPRRFSHTMAVWLCRPVRDSGLQFAQILAA